MKLRMVYRAVGIMLLAAGFILSSAGAQEAASKRKLLNHEPPAYPTLARNISLDGIVTADVLVLPNGTVKSVSVVGGHPILVQAAVNTLAHWIWEPATHETHELVKVKFSRPD
jgi:outer membrane biosynthesis protein TonB